MIQPGCISVLEEEASVLIEHLGGLLSITGDILCYNQSKLFLIPERQTYREVGTQSCGSDFLRQPGCRLFFCHLFLIQGIVEKNIGDI